MRLTTMPVPAMLCAALLPAGLAAANAGHAADARGSLATMDDRVVHGTSVAGCDILILWHTYRGRISFGDTQVRVKGAPFWRGLPFTGTNPRISNGRVFNWGTELRQERCATDRRYRFRVVAPDSTLPPVRSNVPYAGTERWLYFPSSTGWTQRTTIDLGYLDLCVTDGTKCSKPYYPSGPTPVLKPN